MTSIEDAEECVQRSLVAAQGLPLVPQLSSVVCPDVKE
jgi:hypothetical protein